ncbi:MAG: S-methyl-5'-thioinosine phosphorylase [Gammaproteobacteria bacterium]
MGDRRLLAVIGGSAAEAVQGLRRESASWEETRWGKASAPVHRARLADAPLLWLARHGEPHAIAPHRINYRANLAALADCGATHVLALNTVGGIATGARAGTLWIPVQIVDYTWGRESSFLDGVLQPLDHVEFGEPYHEGLRQALVDAARAAGVAVEAGGVYGCTQGPRLETAAEIRRMRRDGCDLVGMTGMPEAALARELGLPYASLAMVVNPAAGIGNEPVSMEAIRRESAACMARASQLLAALLSAPLPG